MLTRICQIAAITTCLLLAVIGLLAAPVGVLTGWAVAAVLLGPLAATIMLTAPRPDDAAPAGAQAVAARTAAVRVGAATAIAMMGLTVIVAGLIALLGALAVPVAAIALAAVATAGWRHRQAWRAAINTQLTGVEPTIRPGTAVERTNSARRDRAITLGGAGPPLGPVAAVGSEALATATLCGAWQRSYWMLQDLPAGPTRVQLVAQRQAVLDELERRDPDGFARWLATDPRAGSDPGRYLRVEH